MSFNIKFYYLIKQKKSQPEEKIRFLDVAKQEISLIIMTEFFCAFVKTAEITGLDKEFNMCFKLKCK